MAVFTYTSRIREQVDVTAQTDMSLYQECCFCGKKPRVFRITWGSRKNTGLIAECCPERDGSWLENWNRFNIRATAALPLKRGQKLKGEKL